MGNEADVFNSGEILLESDRSNEGARPRLRKRAYYRKYKHTKAMGESWSILMEWHVDQAQARMRKLMKHEYYK